MSELLLFDSDLPSEIRADQPDTVAYSNMAILPIQLRFNGIRMAMFSYALSIMEEEEVRSHALTAFAKALESFGLVEQVVTGRQPMPELHRSALEWMRDVVDRSGHDLSSLPKFRAMCSANLQRLQAGQRLDNAEVEEMVRFTYSDFHGSVVSLVDTLRAALKAHEELLQKAAEDAKERARGAAKQIDGITRTVRLISLNAAVEAARAGDAGRGFSVIAQEIKALSEKAEVAGREVQSGIDDILVSSRN